MTSSIHLDQPMAEIVRAMPAARLCLFQRFGICGFCPTQTLRDVLASGGVADPDKAVRDLNDCNVALETEYRRGNLEIWRNGLRRYIDGLRSHIQQRAASIPTQPDGPDPFTRALDDVLIENACSGWICSLVDAGQTIRSELERLQVEKWTLGLRASRPPSEPEVNHTVRAWNSTHGIPHKQWLDLCIRHLLARENFLTPAAS